MHACPKCGGTIEGDGYIEVRHCEFADPILFEDHEPDSKVVFCDFKEENIEKEK